jgi:large subunit ribosomal protein L36e
MVKALTKSHPTVIAIGKHKGYPTTEYKPASKRANLPKQASKKGRIGKRVKLIRQVIGEVSGVSSYEKRVIEFLKAGSMKDTKRALKTSKKALGTHRRAKLKRESLMNLLRAQQAQRDKEREARDKKDKKQ